MRIKCEWLKWRATSGVLCDRGVPLKLKGKFYLTTITPALLYVSKCWVFRKDHSKKNGSSKTANASMDEWTYLGVANMEEKMKDIRLKWFGIVQR